MFTVFLCDSIPSHRSGSSQKPLPFSVTRRFHSLLCSRCVFLASWKRLLKTGAGRHAGAVNAGRKGARNPLQQSSPLTACRSTFCSLSVVSHSQFKALALFPSLSLSPSLDHLLAHSRTHSLTHSLTLSFCSLLPSLSLLFSSLFFCCAFPCV